MVEAAEFESNWRSNYSESAGTRDVSEDIVDLHRNLNVNMVRRCGEGGHYQGHP